jgi:hypothetical protein
MIRRIFNLNEPFREIKKEDSFKPFESKLLTACGSTLSSMYLENKDDKYVWVYDVNDEILAVISFLDRDKEFYVDLVSNNFSIPKNILSQTKPGSSLYQILEDVARMNSISKITLDSVPEMIDYWKIEFDFKQIGDPFTGKFCKLYPMSKNL